jgi:zinc protease
MAFLLDHLKPADLERARAAVLNEWDMRVGGGGVRALWALASEELYPEGHPYRLPNDDPKDIEAIELSHVQWFFQRYYGPSNARLVVVGDFDPKTTRERIHHYFGPLRAHGPAPKPREAAMPTLRAEHRLEVEWPFKNQLCAMVWPTPLTDPADRAALDVVMEHLSTLIFHRLVREQGLARYTSSSQDDLARGSELSVLVSFDAKKSRAEVLKAVNAILTRVREGGLSDKALGRAKQRLARRAFFAGESLSSRANALAGATHVERDELEVRAERYAAVRSEDVQRVASTWLTAGRHVQLCAVHDEDAPMRGKLIDREIVDGVKP